MMLNMFQFHSLIFLTLLLLYHYTSFIATFNVPLYFNFQWLKKRSSDSKFSNVLLLKQKRERVHDITSPTPWNTQAALSLSLFLLPCYPLNQSTLSNSSKTTLQPIRLLKTWTWLSFNILIWTNLQTRSEQNLFHGRYATCLYCHYNTLLTANGSTRTTKGLVLLLQTK